MYFAIIHVVFFRLEIYFDSLKSMRSWNFRRCCNVQQANFRNILSSDRRYQRQNTREKKKTNQRHTVSNVQMVEVFRVVNLFVLVSDSKALTCFLWWRSIYGMNAFVIKAQCINRRTMTVAKMLAD